MFKFLLLVLVSTLCNVSGADNPAVQLLEKVGIASVYRINTKPAREVFASGLDPIMATLQEIETRENQDRATFAQNIIKMITIVGTRTLEATKKQRYEQLSTECTTIKDAIPLRKLELIRINDLLQVKMPTGRATSAINAALHPDQPRVTNREQRLVQSGRRERICRPDGTVFVPMGPDSVFVPFTQASSHNPARQMQEEHDRLLDQEKRQILAMGIDLVKKLQLNSEEFLSFISSEENEFSYNLELNSGRDLQKLMGHAKTLVQQYPEGEQKSFWRDIYRKHVEEYVALQRASETPSSPEQLEQARQRQFIADKLAFETEQKELDERKQKQEQIRELRLQQETSGDDDEEQQPPAVAPVARPAEPMEVLAFDKFDPSGLEALGVAVKTKFDAAIANIKNHEDPADFRGSIPMINLNVLHCGLSESLRLYYSIRNGTVYVLDVSNHDLDRLQLIVKRFMEELKDK